MTEIFEMSAEGLLDAYRDKKLSPVEVTHSLLDRIEEINPKLNAVVTLTAEHALKRAEEAEKAYAGGGEVGRMEGVPIAIKDNTFTAGVRTTYGSKLYEDFVPDQDAVLVERVKREGGVILGKTNLPEMGLIPVTDSPLFGPCCNPWSLECTSGGSSGGAAAGVAAGLYPFAQGNDGGGSIRIPSALCGVFGLKPTFGRIPIYPHLPGWETLNHEGPIARRVEDAALLLDVMAGYDIRDRHSLPSVEYSFREALQGEVKGMKLAYTPDLGYAPAIEPEVKELTRQAALAFEGMGCEVDEIDPGLPNLEPDLLVQVICETVTANEDRLEEWQKVAFPLYLPFLDLIGVYKPNDVIRVQFRREELWDKLRPVFERYDLLLCPTSAVTAFKLEPPGPLGPMVIDGQDVGPLAWMSYTFPFNFTGQPAASVPCGMSSDGLPVGLQLVGKMYDEVSILRAAAALEQAQPWPFPESL
jgi:Asp-tRNA(Asn)/Glu-tRNA(Gln) amidotransferase A subunit family amidase